jgi:hypothetical protein
MKINSGIPLFNASVNAQGEQNQPPNVLFNASTTSTTSHNIDVGETAIAVSAFNISGNTITVNMVGNDGLGDVTSPLHLNGKTVQLSSTNTMIILDVPGRYNFTLSGGLGSVSCIITPTGSSYWSYGLRAFATAS